MADQPENTKKKRIVKNPETFRERAIKAAEGIDKPSRASRVKSSSGKIASPVFKPIGRALTAVFGSVVFKPFRRPLRLIGLVLLPRFVRNSWKELKLVHWPSWHESRALTYAVLVFAVAFGATIAVVDYGLDKLFRDILLK